MSFNKRFMLTLSPMSTSNHRHLCFEIYDINFVLVSNITVFDFDSHFSQNFPSVLYAECDIS